MNIFLRTTYLCAIFCKLICSGNAIAQTNVNSNWTYLKGDSSRPGYPDYGTKGVASPTNKPGARSGNITWKNLSGNLWMYGGSGVTMGSDNSPLADLWKYDPVSNQWTWVNGVTTINATSIYGTVNVPNSNNRPGNRSTCLATWVDGTGNLWMYGGYGIMPDNNYGELIDLWKYDPVTNIWTWMGGPTTFNNSTSIYGVQGVPAVTNRSGSRTSAGNAVDNNGNLWIFGGDGKAANNGLGTLNDLWKYNVTTKEWTWMGGGTVTNSKAVFGTKGVAAATNNPGARRWYNSENMWPDNVGNIWLYGGYGYTSLSPAGGYMTDLWKYEISTNMWIWVSGDTLINRSRVSGSVAVPAVTNRPGARYAENVTAYNNNIYLYGGVGVTGAGVTIGAYNDMWVLDQTNYLWTWIKGDSTKNEYSNYNVKGVTVPGNKLGGRQTGYFWNDGTGNLWAWGGVGYYVAGVTTEDYPHDDLWKYNIASNNFTWLHGNTGIENMGVLSTMGQSSVANKPGARADNSCWTDSTGNLWLFGGTGFGAGLINGKSQENLHTSLNDLWKYNPVNKEWTWMKGDDTSNSIGVYGTKGVFAPNNRPSARYQAVSAMGSDGYFWLQGGMSPSRGGVMNDLWKYNPVINQWAWISGDSAENRLGVYGTMGTPAATNKPGGRVSAVCWVDNNSKFWLWGGSGWDGNNGNGFLNDLWKYDPVTELWTWVKGEKIYGKKNVTVPFGTTGTSDPANQPGSRAQSSAWKDAVGNLWLFGGVGYGFFSSTSLDEVWKYNPTTNVWTWVNGDLVDNNPGVYGTMGVESSTNKIGGRSGFNSWKDKAGNFWVFGGIGYSSQTSLGWLSDLWKYNPVTNRWTWMKGDMLPNLGGIYGPPSTPSPLIKPGSRYASMASWTGRTGNLYFFGGDGYGWPGNASNLPFNNDLWSFGNYQPAIEICSGGDTSMVSSLSGASYQWQVSNDFVNFTNIANGTNYSGVTTNTLHLINIPLTFNNYQYRCIVDSDSSNVFTVFVSATGVVPDVTIAAPVTNICSGEMVTFTATPTNGGNIPAYQWQVNGANAGTNNNTFTTSTLTNNAQVKVIMTSSLSCASPTTATSNIITMTVTPAPTAHAGNDTVICAGSSVQLQGSGGTNYFWTPAAGLNNPNIANPIATPLATTAYILRVSNGGSCIAYDTILITVLPSATPAVTIGTASNNICTGTAATFTATPTNGGATPAYQWQVNGVNAGTNSNTFTTLTLTNNAQVKVVLTSSLGCALPANATSNVITMTVAATPNANAGNDVNICTGASTQLLATGGTTYSWSPVAGLNNANIANPIASPAATTTYTVTVSNGINCTATDAVVVSVGPPATPVVSISTTSNTICYGNAVTFTAVATYGGSNPVFQWQVNGINAGTNNNTFTTSTLNNNDQVKVILTSNSACITSPTATSNIISITVDQLATPAISLADRLFTVTNPDAAATYTWQQKINNIWGNVVPAATGITYTALSGGEYRTKAIKGACTAYSASQTTARNLNTFMHPFGIYLYPNPNTGILNIDSIRISQRWETLDITDVTGRIVLTFNIKNQSSVSLNISMLKPGTYFAQLKKIDGVFYTVEFVKL